MSRCDQYIGLTKAATEFIKKLKNEKNVVIETYTICDSAFNPDPIRGERIILGNRIYKEELQFNPWSSGPMYFLHVGIYNKNTGKLIGYIGSWEEDKNVKGEVDYINGKYYIF